MLIIFQYLSLIITSILGLLGLLFNFKDKETGKLTKWGRVACTILILSLCLGITSKTIELNNQKKKEDSEATKARIAAEQTLKIATNVERVANAITDVNVDISFSIPISAEIFKNFNNTIHHRLGIRKDDTTLNLKTFSNLIPNDKSWEHIAQNLVNVSPVIMIYPKGADVPNCIVQPIKSIFEDRKTNGIHFDVPMRIEKIDYPQLDELFSINFKGKIEPSRNERPQILSLLDFNDATIIIYMAVPLYQTEETDSAVGRIQAKKTINYQLFPSLQYNDCSVEFTFDGNRRIYIRQLKYQFDSCYKYPYFIGHISPNP